MNCKYTKIIDDFKSIFSKEKTKKGQKIKKESDTRKSDLIFDTNYLAKTSNINMDFNLLHFFYLAFCAWKWILNQKLLTVGKNNKGVAIATCQTVGKILKILI